MANDLFSEMLEQLTRKEEEHANACEALTEGDGNIHYLEQRCNRLWAEVERLRSIVQLEIDAERAQGEA